MKSKYADYCNEQLKELTKTNETYYQPKSPPEEESKCVLAKQRSWCVLI